jgi:hypothetical protein
MSLMSDRGQRARNMHWASEAAAAAEAGASLLTCRTRVTRDTKKHLGNISSRAKSTKKRQKKGSFVLIPPISLTLNP